MQIRSQKPFRYRMFSRVSSKPKNVDKSDQRLDVIRSHLQAREFPLNQLRINLETKSSFKFEVCKAKCTNKHVDAFQGIFNHSTDLPIKNSTKRCAEGRRTPERYMVCGNENVDFSNGIKCTTDKKPFKITGP